MGTACVFILKWKCKGREREREGGECKSLGSFYGCPYLIKKFTHFVLLPNKRYNDLASISMAVSVMVDQIRYLLLISGRMTSTVDRNPNYIH